jgi:F0F1-type ATP synthase membrane subunit a
MIVRMPSWIYQVGLALAVVVVVAVVGIRTKGTRPVENTRLMAVGRFILLVVIAVLFYMFLRTRSGH